MGVRAQAALRLGPRRADARRVQGFALQARRSQEMSKEESELPRRSDDDKRAFKREMTDVIPHLRAFARGLCGRPDMADDLVQETLLKAWAAQDRFEPGTSMRAWTFVILRN